MLPCFISSAEPVESFRRLLLKALLSTPLVFPALPAFAEVAQSYALRAEVKEWANDVCQHYHIDYKWVMSALSKARYVKTSERIMSQPSKTASAKPRDWSLHRKHYVNEERVHKGRLFMRRYANTLSECEERWGVPASIIAAVIGVETIYGKSMGRFRVLDVLCTLSFDYRRRSEYFQQELAMFLLYCHNSKMAPQHVMGSFAGAIGMCQFMPSNLVRRGVDIDGDHRVDLRKSAYDAIGSVANYLKYAGWNRNLPVAWDCELIASDAKNLCIGSIRTDTTVQNALDAGFSPLEPIRVSPETPVFCVELANGGRRSQWRLCTQNYAALLDYNRSYFYVETVRELAREVARPIENKRLPSMML